MTIQLYIRSLSCCLLANELLNGSLNKHIWLQDVKKQTEPRVDIGISSLLTVSSRIKDCSHTD
jgi:hypothetical protein